MNLFNLMRLPQRRWSRRHFAYNHKNDMEESKMQELTIVKKNGGAYIDSRQVAEVIGKDHNHLLRDIRGYSAIIENNSNASKIGRIEFFIESTYVDARGREKPCYLLTKMGCEVVANKLTGEKGVLFTVAYVRRFNELEATERAEIEKRSVTPQLKTFNKAVRNVLTVYANADATYEETIDFLRGAYKPFGIEVKSVEGKYHWTVTSIARFLRIYSMSGRPHGHAVAAIIEKLNIGLQHVAVVPYGMVGVTIRYDDYVLNAVADWIIANGKPHNIPYLDFEYHVYYDCQPGSGRRTTLFDDENFDFTADEPDAMCIAFDGDCDKCHRFCICCDGV